MSCRHSCEENMVLFFHFPHVAISMSTANTEGIFPFFFFFFPWMFEHEHNRHGAGGGGREGRVWCKGHGADSEMGLTLNPSDGCRDRLSWRHQVTRLIHTINNAGLKRKSGGLWFFFFLGYLVVIRIQVLHQTWRTPTTNISLKKAKAITCNYTLTFLLYCLLAHHVTWSNKNTVSIKFCQY